MKRFAAVAALGALLAGPAMADPVHGIWKTEVDDGSYAYITFSNCGAELCGVISRTFNGDGEYKSPNIGKQLVWGMSNDGPGKYAGGTIWQPSTGKKFRSKMTLNGNVLKVAGCVGPICKKQTWSRVK
ncbi:hypothetical protein ATO10_14894 [Actibacterium atlanticum]|uniref:DUF2147 domain-containing protein n=1 Tax=Actibacterium atlanticum TaxID=1461693 RepID=A0A058ZH82_9RHOB|nr:DUF2147 domain-containing protein [Actibacterium atlanticum]KCV80948.1 hypothetical protein ATO10_14894 [Actibacterium atlanticum]